MSGEDPDFIDEYVIINIYKVVSNKSPSKTTINKIKSILNIPF